MKQGQTTITLKIGAETKKEMLDFFADLKRDKTPPYAVFQAIDGDCVVTMYESGKVVFQGKDADLASEFWIETEKIHSGQAVVTNSQDKKKEKKKEKILPFRIRSIGSDEVGTGDYFGPIVVTATYVGLEHIDFLLDLGVRDSKKLTDAKIMELVPQIIQKIPYKTFILNNLEYNRHYGQSMNMNKIKAVLHNKVLYEMKSKGYEYDYIVVDQFEYPKAYYSHISASLKQVRDIFFLTKAEDQCLSVACASMISRYIFIQQMEKISSELGMILPKGAGDKVDEIGKKIVALYGNERLKSLAKLNFKNTEKILKEE